MNCSNVLDTTVKEKENSLENSPSAKSHSVNMTNMWNKCSKRRKFVQMLMICMQKFIENRIAV